MILLRTRIRSLALVYVPSRSYSNTKGYTESRILGTFQSTAFYFHRVLERTRSRYKAGTVNAYDTLDRDKLHLPNTTLNS